MGLVIFSVNSNNEDAGEECCYLTSSNSTLYQIENAENSVNPDYRSKTNIGKNKTPVEEVEAEEVENVSTVFASSLITNVFLIFGCCPVFWFFIIPWVLKTANVATSFMPTNQGFIAFVVAVEALVIFIKLLKFVKFSVEIYLNNKSK